MPRGDDRRYSTGCGQQTDRRKLVSVPHDMTQFERDPTGTYDLIRTMTALGYEPAREVVRQLFLMICVARLRRGMSFGAMTITIQSIDRAIHVFAIPFVDA